MINIEVEKIEETDNKWQFRVIVSQESSSTQHQVSLTHDDWKRLTLGKEEPESLIERSFRFLLERESKESILEQFDLMLINHYFPEYESMARDYLLKIPQ